MLRTGHQTHYQRKHRSKLKHKSHWSRSTELDGHLVLKEPVPKTVVESRHTTPHILSPICLSPAWPPLVCKLAPVVEIPANHISKPPILASQGAHSRPWQQQSSCHPPQCHPGWPELSDPCMELMGSDDEMATETCVLVPLFRSNHVRFQRQGRLLAFSQLWGGFRTLP